ncbi:MAG TPA: ATP-binding protein [Gaiellaceae bacterium]|nr:ATP-binding protein [Gaiellaceae bacterium]
MARGQLRIYLGAAAGVGKTYAMLNEGRRRAGYGEDVVIGYVEPHRRPKTTEQIGDLEIVPRKDVEYRGATIGEMDIDAVLARRPQVALVDELAHTNAPGSRNDKRWEDVEELLDAGISVISTLNIQHLESLNDVVEEITGVKQQETIPDEVVRRADELQLVDLTPVALRNRLARGDVYPPERIDAALANYFRPGNLSALRELALAWLANRVDEGLEEYRHRHGIHQPWETRERVLVALTGSPDGERLIRRAARMAQRMNGELVAVHVIPQDGLAAPTAELLERQKELVAEVGASYHEVVGEDIGDALLDAARTLNATQIVMGASRRSRWQRLTRGSVIGKVIRGSGTRIDVHVVSHPDAAEEAFTLPRTRRPASLPQRRVVLGLVLAVVGPPVLAYILSTMRGQVGLPSVLLLFLLLVVWVSAIGGLWPALLAAVSGFLLVNWYFTPPLYTFTIGEGENVLALAVFLAVAVTVSLFVDLAARRSVQGRRAKAEAEALARLAGSAPVDTVLDSLRRVLNTDGAAVLHRTENGWRIEATSGGRIPDTPDAATTTIELDDEHVLVLGGRPIRAEDQRVLEAFSKELRSSVELGELEAEVEAAGVVSAANELRAAILSAVSHDLRTPLSAIKASVTSLLQEDVEWTPEARREFLETIAEETDRLNALVGNLLDMSRLQTDALEIMPSRVGLEEVLPAALSSLGVGDASIELDVPETLPRVLADPGLLERALANVIDNAVRFSPPGVPPRITAGATDGYVDVRVVDQGPGVPATEVDRLFMPFQRIGDSSSDEGVGLGLAVAKGFVEAMGGEVEVESTPGGGLTIVTRLRVAE